MPLQVFDPNTSGKVQVEVHPANGYDPIAFPPFTALDREVVRGAMSGQMINAILLAMFHGFFNKGPWFNTPFAPINWILPTKDFVGGHKVIVRIIFPFHLTNEGGIVQRFIESLEPIIAAHFPVWRDGKLDLVRVQVVFLDMYEQESRAEHYARNDAIQARVMVAGANSPHAAAIAEHVIGLGSVTETNTRHTQFDPKAT